MDKLKATRALVKSTSRKRVRPGKLSNIEKVIVAEIVNQRDLTPTQSVALAVALDRSPDRIAQTIRDARATLQGRSLQYIDKHMQALDLALENRDADTARKAAWQAIEKISARSSDGKVERIVESNDDSNQSGSSRIMIGIALGGVRHEKNSPSDS